MKIKAKDRRNNTVGAIQIELTPIESLAFADVMRRVSTNNDLYEDDNRVVKQMSAQWNDWLDSFLEG